MGNGLREKGLVLDAKRRGERWRARWTGCDVQEVIETSGSRQVISYRCIDDSGRKHDVNQLEEADETATLVIADVGGGRHRRASEGV